ncbi:PREDICTED: ankyrin repeat and SAM domain-containing protein 3-like isoform X3 [Wasmannia auropunctata]|uniref:ankyrin repeat and SAM domain-containing protein 3-like isoform X3 n=1 Tax=Wasmannia auropunctata TaxID=64793 RepID=UPI0005EFC9B8|nr:PREDICTED: ankyrin repeat and SAM domain-containing protein 3-like isoform X3 [Wasmannia auropunctata]
MNLISVEREKMLRPESHDSAKKAVETQVIAAMQKQGYTLNAVNSCDENLLHVSAANGCLGIVREILDKKENLRVVDRKNKFGWTPLMQAIRNGNIDTVKLLLERNADVNQMTYLGMSALGLAAAISKEMFETVYNACPEALANTANDDITPLCVAAMKNDKELFLRLLKSGVFSTTNGYTRIMMKCSTVPEIAALVNEDLVVDDYWNDTSDNIEVISEQDVDSTVKDRSNDDENKGEKLKLHLLPVIMESDKQSRISPNLTYDVFTFPKAAGKDSLTEKSNVPSLDKDANEKTTENDLEQHSAAGEDQSKSSPVARQKSNFRFQSVRPADLDMKNISCNFNVTLGFSPEFSPVKSPHVPEDVNEENVFGENTPTPPRCKTPPKGMLLNWPQTKMIMVLKRFGLSQHISVFLEQEVDFDLFLTLTDKDLIEIGIEHERDRRDLLEAIKECINLGLLATLSASCDTVKILPADLSNLSKLLVEHGPVRKSKSSISVLHISYKFVNSGYRIHRWRKYFYRSRG